MLGIASIIVCLILSAPLLAANGHPALATGIYAAFAPLCHQHADRSLFLEGLPMAVCTRCFGIYFGFWAAMLVLMIIPAGKRISLSLRWLVLAMLPVIVDALGGWAGLFTNTHFSRWITGMVAGVGVAGFIVGSMRRMGQFDERKWT